MLEMTTEEIQLTAHHYAVSYLIDRGVTGGKLREEVEYCAYRGAIQLAMHLSLWGHDDEPRLLADYPKTLWDHIKATLRLKHERVYVYQQEAVIYPKLPMDKYEPRLTIRTWTASKLH